MRKGIVLIALTLLAARLPAGAQTPEQPAQLFDTGTAWDLGQGGAVTAVRGNLAGMLWNPAALADLTQRQVVYAEALRSFPKSLRFVAYGQNGEGGPPGGLAYLRVDNAVYDLKETAILYTFAQQWTDRLGLGVTMKLSRYEYPGDAKELLSFDAGALYDVNPALSFGVSVCNINEPKIRDAVVLSETQTLAPLTAVRRVNAGLQLRLSPKDRPGVVGAAGRVYHTRVTMDLFDVTDEIKRELRFGIEHDLNANLVARAGLLSSTPTAGIGVRLRNLTLNGAVLFGREGHRATESMLSLASAF
ncbi:MAG: hypothetical protein GX774_21995 [Armatimonadetes bacterium]|jgi:hypothetical protein|nr:hypothetical protein [Armatimonadota bacterium]